MCSTEKKQSWSVRKIWNTILEQLSHSFWLIHFSPETNFTFVNGLQYMFAIQTHAIYEQIWTENSQALSPVFTGKPFQQWMDPLSSVMVLWKALVLCMPSWLIRKFPFIAFLSLLFKNKVKNFPW